MSRKSRSEYVGEKRRAYASAGPVKHRRILDEVCETLGYTRKYVNRLLTGRVRYRERRGRGRAYGDDVLGAARTLWEAVGCPCTTYFVPGLPRIVREYEECVALIRPGGGGQVRPRLSASTLDRAFRGLARTKPFSATGANRRSGRNRPLMDGIECRSGEEVMACRVAPGDTQIDTVAHCGGDMGDNFFRTLTQTDGHTQWTEITPTWNRGMHSTVAALQRLERRFPFPVTAEHADNGPEFINYAMAEMQGRRRHVTLSRSRSYHKNDNAHAGQKNGAVVRELLGEMRLDCGELEDDLIRLERDWSDYCNFFRRTKMIVSKEKRADGKGFVRRHQEGGPRTPYQRVIESGVLDREREAALRGWYGSLNGVRLYQDVVRRLKRILRRQDEWRTRMRRRNGIVREAGVEASALRAAPPGTAPDLRLPDGAVDLCPKAPGAEARKARSVQQLTNQKRRRQSQGALPT